MKYQIFDPEINQFVGTATKVGDEYKWDIESGNSDIDRLYNMFKATYSDSVRKIMGGKPYIYVQMTDLMQELF